MLLVALVLPSLLARMRAEESLLRAQFGGEYEGYCARTSRLIPGFIRTRTRYLGVRVGTYLLGPCFP